MLPRLDAAQIESMGEADRELTEEGQPPKRSVPKGRVTRLQDPKLRAAMEDYAVNLAIGYYREVGGTDSDLSPAPRAG